MDLKKIEDLNGLMSNFLPPTKVVKGHEIARLTAPGENYGSLIVSLKIDIDSSSNDDPETIHAVAKMPPPSELLQKLFNIPITCFLETGFYKTIVPSLKKFQKEQGVEEFECFPQFYGSRLSFDPETTTADENAVLIMENLNFSGFESVEKSLGFDLETTELILEELAKFHSTFVAMKLVNPQEFEKSIKPFFVKFKLFENDNQEEFTRVKTQEITETLEENETFKELIPKIENLIKTNSNNRESGKNSDKFIKEPFCTLTHCDLWINNVMVKFENKKPKKIKFVDFQMYENGLPSSDVIFFLLTSVQTPVLQQHFDYLIGCYHKIFVENLKQLKCENVDFSLSYFEWELKTSVKTFEFFHSMFMLNPIYADKDSVKELDKVSADDFSQKNVVSDQHKERIHFIVDLCRRKNWI